MQDIPCICGANIEANYIEEHRKHCSIYQMNKQEWNKLLDLDKFAPGSTVVGSGVGLAMPIEVCGCECHTNKHVLHCMPCCDGQCNKCKQYFFNLREHEKVCGAR